MSNEPLTKSMIAHDQLCSFVSYLVLNSSRMTTDAGVTSKSSRVDVRLPKENVPVYENCTFNDSDIIKLCSHYCIIKTPLTPLRQIQKIKSMF